MQWKVITSEEDFKEAIEGCSGPVAADVETFGLNPKEGRLLGLSLSYDARGVQLSIYIPTNYCRDGEWTKGIGDSIKPVVANFLQSQDLIGHNFTYDKKWIEDYWGISTNWIADTRIAWHLASAPSGPRPYGLKDAQTELLGWTTKGDGSLKEQVEARGGSLKTGDHYLADLEILAEYACLDTLSTLQVYKKLTPFFDKYDYWPMLRKMMDYNELLERNSSIGIAVDVVGLEKAHNRIVSARDAAMKRVNKELADVISDLEQDWLDRRVGEYKRAYNRSRLLAHPEDWRRFNWNSDKDKRELFYDKLNNEVVYTTDSGRPSTNADSVKMFEGDWTRSYLTYEKNNTLASNFSGPYLSSVRGGRLHPGFNICGTVSYRLSGFKPYLLNAPFDERLIMKNFKCDEGWVGVHADLSAIEPTITAHFSEDSTLQKVFGKGLGDIYLDLALTMFPNDMELKLGYNPNELLSKDVKERFSKQRKIAKIIHLAVSYTGTKHTVSRNLRKEGFDIDIWTADRLVNAYWRRFRRVAEFTSRLRELNRKQGYLRNVIGRIIQVPDPEYKDLFNRFVQSSAHDVLVLWVLEIYKLCNQRGIPISPVLLDCHDSSSNATTVDRVDDLKQVYIDALENVNNELGLSVKVRMEMKTFTTLAGLKGED